MKSDFSGGLKRGLSMVVPAYNEDQSLPILVEQLIQTFKKNSLKGEIIIVDDGSTDETGKITEELSKKYDFIKAFHHRRRRTRARTTAIDFIIVLLMVFIVGLCIVCNFKSRANKHLLKNDIIERMSYCLERNT